MALVCRRGWMAPFATAAETETHPPHTARSSTARTTGYCLATTLILILTHEYFSAVEWAWCPPRPRPGHTPSAWTVEKSGAGREKVDDFGQGSPGWHAVSPGKQTDRHTFFCSSLLVETARSLLPSDRRLLTQSKFSIMMLT